MKKVLFLLLVFGLTSAANAGLIEVVNAAFEFSVNGEPQPAEITLVAPSGEVTLDLKLLAGHTLGNLDFTWNLSNSQAELLYSGITLASYDFGLSVNVNSNAQSVRIAGGNIMSGDHSGPEVQVDNLILHCLEDTDLVLEVIYSGTTKIDGVSYFPAEWDGTVLHTLIIHQIPEPATIVLLGLGGLLLRKRRKLAS